MKKTVIIRAAIAVAAVSVATMPLASFAEAVTADDVTAVVAGWQNAREALGEQLEAAPASVKEYPGLGGTGTYYVVTLEGGGYVVTSGDTSLEPVLAYSKTGTWIDDVKRNPLMAMVEIDIAAAVSRTAGSAVQGDSTTAGSAVEDENGQAARSTTGLRLAATGDGTTAGSAIEDENGQAARSTNAAKWAKYKAAASKKGGLRLQASEPNSDLRVSPLIESAWSQTGPYGTGPGVAILGGENFYTPGNVYCGCVATMAAQMMKYWEWPKGTNISAIANYYGSVTFTNKSYGTSVVNSWSVSEGFPDDIKTKDSSKSQLTPSFGGTYDWANMPNETQSYLNDTQKAAIGKLTRDAGIACCMGYSNDGSGASGSIFAHRAADQFAYTSGQDVGGWNDANRDALLACLDAGIPCGIAVSHSSSGHAIIADGYGYNSSGTLYVHFNYGWGSTGPSDWYTPPSVGDYTSVNDIIANVYPPYVSKYDRTIVSGRVFSNGSVQGSVTVTATNRETGFTTNVTSNSKGIYSFMLPRGYYTFSATKNGSSAKVEADVKLGIAGTGSNAKSGNIHGLDLNLGTAVTAPSVALTHRWSFAGNLNDSVGSSNASTIGSNVNLVDGKAVCTGNGAAQGSLNLGSNLLDTDGATVEVWARQDEAVGNARVFEYGVDTSGYFTFTWSHNGDIYGDLEESISGGASGNAQDKLAPYALGVFYHISATFERQGDGSTVIRIMRRDAASGALLRASVLKMPNGIQSLTDPTLYLGRSLWNDADARATYDEVRVWQGVLSDAQLKASALAGPDTNLSTLPWNASAVRYVAKAVWQGGTPSSAADLENSANWSCLDQSGDAISGVPGAKSLVIIPNGTTAFTIPEGYTPTWRKLQIGSEGKATAQWGKKTYTMSSAAAQLEPSASDYEFQGDADVDELARSVAPSVQDAPAGLSGKQFRYDGWVNVSAAQAGRWAITAFADDYAALRFDDEWLSFTVSGDARTSVVDVPKGWHRFTLIIGDWYGGYGGSGMTTDHSCAAPVTVSIDGGNSIAFTSSNFQFGAPDRAAPVVTLAGDCDWSGIGEVSLDSGTELDLNGHTLTVDKMDSSFLGANIKDTSASPGTITLVEGGAVNRDNITVQSDIKTAYATTEAFLSAEATFWLDASDTSTLTINGSGEVTRWDSRVGSNYATQGRHYYGGSTFLYPTYDATTYGIPTVNFGSAVQSGWGNDNPGRDLNINTPVAVKTVFFATRIQNDGKAAWLGQEDAIGTSGNCFRRDENGAYNDKRSGQPGQSRFANFWIGTDVVADMTTEHPPADTFCVFSAQMDDSATYTAEHLAAQCGGLHSGGKQLSELIIFNRALSDEERTEVTQYLQSKWVYSRVATLAHRWSFDGTTDEENLADSVGGAVAKKMYKTSASTTAEGGTVNWENGKAVLPGGNGMGHLNFGTGILGTGNAATLEVWVKKTVDPNNWAYLVNYGIIDSSTANHLSLSVTQGSGDYARWGKTENRVNANDKGGKNMISPPVGAPYYVSLTLRDNGDGSTAARWTIRDGVTGFIYSDQSVTVTSWTLASAAAGGWALTLGNNPWTNSTLDLGCKIDEVRIWNGALCEEQLHANVLAGPDAILGGGESNVVIEPGMTFTVPTVGGYGYKTTSLVSLGAGSKIRFDTTGYFGRGLRFKAGEIDVPYGSVLDYVELSDSVKYTATMEDANTILVQLKSTIPYESTWKGGTPSSAADLANAANWTSVNAQGTAISAAPTDKTTVILSAAALATFALPSGFTPNWGRVLFGGHTATQCGRIGSAPNPKTTDYRDASIGSYTSIGALGFDVINGGSTSWQTTNLKSAQVRFDGWFYVTAAQSGKWDMRIDFDDTSTFAIDGEWVFTNPKWEPNDLTAGCFVSEGWHRFTFIGGDTGGGYGCDVTVNDVKVPFSISINGGSAVAFYNAFTFGSDTDTVTLSGDADWRTFGPITLGSGLTIDLNGHNLTVSEIDSTSLGATITNTSGTASTLTTYSGAVGAGVNAGNVTVSKVPVVTATWTGAYGNNDVMNPGNWNCYDSGSNLLPGALPTADTTVTVSDAQAAIAFSGAAPSYKWLDIGTVANKTGTVTIDEGSSLNVSFTSNRSVQMGTVNGATANFNVNGGAVTIGSLNAPSSANSAKVTVNVTGGTLTMTGWTDFGRNSSANAVFNQSGGTVNAGNNLWIGRSNNGTATYNLSNGTLNQKGGTLDLGESSGCKGIFNMTGGSLTSTVNYSIGRNGVGEMTISGGTTSLRSVYVGNERSARGTIIQTGGTFTVGNANTWLTIGQSENTAGLYLQTSGTLNTADANANLYVGHNGRGVLDAAGTITVTKAGYGVFVGNDATGRGELRLRDGGNLTTSFIKKNNDSAVAGAAFGASTLTTKQNNTTFINGMNGLVFDPGTFTLNAAHNVAISNNVETFASAGARIAKTGAGTVTIDRLPPVDDFAVNAGTVALSADNVSTRSSVNAASGNLYPESPSDTLLANNYLLHRWNFNGHCLDLIGTNHAFIVGTGSVTYNTAADIQLPGGDRGVGYIDCGSNIIPAELGDTPFTIEFWAKPKSNENWAQWCAFGNSSDANGTGGALTGLIIAPKSGAGSYPSFRMVGAQTSNNIAIGSGNLTLDKEYHVALVVKPTGNNTATVTAYIQDPSGAEAIRVKSESVTNWSTATIVQKNFWLGHSHWNDKDVYSTYNEVRVWAAALSQEQVVANGTLGPDVLPVLSATSTLGVTENITVASGATLDLGGHSLTLPSLTGAGTVQNGTLAVTDNLVVNIADCIAGNCITANGTIDFTGAKLVVEDPEILESQKGSITLIRAVSGGSVGGRLRRSATLPSGWTVFLSGSGVELKRSRFVIQLR